MKHICVLLNGPVGLDARVTRFVRTASRIAKVSLFCEQGRFEGAGLFDERVILRALDPALFQPRGLRRYLLLHRHFDAFVKAALDTGDSYDLVYANDYPTLSPAARIARARGARLAYDSHEIYLATVNQFYPSVARFPKSFIFSLLVDLARRIGGRHEQRLIREVDLFVTTNESYASYFRSTYGREQVDVIRNCPETVKSVPSRNRIRDALGLSPGDRVVLYQGMMNSGRGLSQLVLSAEHLDERMRIILLGDGPLRETLLTLVRDRNLSERVRFLDAVPQEHLVAWTAGGDLGMLVLEAINESKRLASANKLFEYMAAGIPMLVSDLPENRRVVDECDSGFLLPDTSPEAIAASIMAVFQDPDEMRRRGENGRRAHLQRYNWEVEKVRLLALLERTFRR